MSNLDLNGYRSTEQQSRHRTLPATPAGALRLLQRKRVRAFCAVCSSLQNIAEVTAVEGGSFDCVLACSHSRSVVLAVKKKGEVQ